MMKKIIFLHGFFASGDCVPAHSLRRALNGEALVLSPDLPMHPQRALEQTLALCHSEQPDLLVGNSCGAFYAHLLHRSTGLPALLGNPHFEMTRFLSERMGPQQYKSQRHDGRQHFEVNPQLVAAFASLERTQFDGLCRDYTDRVWGLFGENDTLAHFEPLFLKHYTHSFHFPGAHTPTAGEVAQWYAPLALRMLETVFIQ